MMKYMGILLCLFFHASGYADIVVHGQEVRLSDLFELPEEVQDAVVMPAPSRGQRQEIPVTFLKILARQYRLLCTNLRSVWIMRGEDEPAPECAVDTVNVPVLSIPKQAGEIIRAEDIALAHVSARLVKREVVQDPEEIIGKVARIAMRASVPVRSIDLQKPVMVKRHAPVVLRVQMQNLLATVRGKALENGGYGDVIRVVNTQSGKVIEGTVYDDNIVDIAPI
ncbi:MAG: flagellar basal body P-ring formation chaperone FlgA [Holosporales bacterium]|jgi:flagella basal body P-ring formation protein FlgA|nr:flagellar basal body P-ring formation chaperone FlgA [Holosporales bacterium]